MQINFYLHSIEMYLILLSPCRHTQFEKFTQRKTTHTGARIKFYDMII